MWNRVQINCDIYLCNCEGILIVINSIKKRRLVGILSRCPKILCAKVSDKMASAKGVDSDQTAPEGAV